MEKWIGKVAFVTGVTSGIGEAIAETLVEQGLQVVGFARRQDRLEKLAKRLASKTSKFHPYAGDVSKEEDIIKAFEWTKNNVGPTSIVINNAGISRTVSMDSGSDATGWRDILNVNVLGLSIGTREALKQMKENNIDGHIININSVAGHKVLNFSGGNMYSASKHAVTVLTESLRMELASQKSKTKITSISPGLVQTEILSISELPPERIEFFKTAPILQSSDIADAVVYVLGTPSHVNITELTVQPVGESF